MSIQNTDVISGYAGESVSEPDEKITGFSSGVQRWARARLDYLKEIPEPARVFVATDIIEVEYKGTNGESEIHGLNPAAMSVIHDVKRSTHDILETHRRGWNIKGRMFASYRLSEEWWKLIQQLRARRPEFPCGDGVGIHHVDEPAGDEPRYTCGNEFCGARYTRETVEEALEEVEL